MPDHLEQYPSNVFDLITVTRPLESATLHETLNKFCRALKDDGVLRICGVYLPEKMIATARLCGFASNLYLGPEEYTPGASPAIYEFIKIKRRLDVTGKG